MTGLRPPGLRPTSVLLSLALAAGGVVALSGSAVAAPAGGALIYGLTTTDGLVTLRTETGLVTSPTPITGLTTGDDLVGIDIRPATGQLYALARSAGTAAGNASLYVIDPGTAQATRVGSPLTVALSGTRFGVDVNPVADAIRVVSNTGQNVRVDPTTGAATADTSLANGGLLAPTPAVDGAAYSNNVAGATSTVLYDLDTANNAVYTQEPNAGALTRSSTLTGTAPSPTGASGFDIDGLDGVAYAALTVGGTTGLYRATLPGNALAAAFTRVGTTNLGAVEDIAVATPRIGFAATTSATAENRGPASLTVRRTGDTSEAATVDFVTSNGTATAGQDYLSTSGTASFAAGAASTTISVPLVDDDTVEPDETFAVTLSNPSANAKLTSATVQTVSISNDDQGALVYGLTSTDTLAQIRTAVGLVGTPQPIQGLPAGADVVGIDVRPSHGRLYALVNTSTVDSLYTIDTTTTVATKAVDLVAAGTTTPFPLAGTSFDIDVNPVVDLLRVVGNTGLNLRVNMDTGAVSSDTALKYAAGSPTPDVRAAAYTNSTASATSTQLFDLDTTQNAVVEQTPPNDGVLVPRAPLGVDPVDEAGFDVDGASNLAYASLKVGGTTGLYAISLPSATTATNAATRLGAFALTGIDDIAVGTPRFTVANAAAEEGTAALVTVTRNGDSTKAGSVAYSTSNGSATAGTDYTAATGTVTFAPGETSKTFTVQTTSDTAVETPETVNLTLGSPSAGSLVGKPGLLTISDVLPSVFSVPANQKVRESAGPAVVTVTRTSTSAPSTVAFATANGSAIAGTDYTATSGTLSFAAGEATKTISVPLINDTLIEPDKTFTVTLTSPSSGASLANATTTVTIDSEDGVTTLTVPSAVTVAENAGPAVVTVTRDTTATVATVNYATANGTATAPSDYTTTTGSLTFAVGEATKTISVPITNDSAIEADESLTLVFSGQNVEADVPNDTTTITITNDDVAGEFSVSPLGQTVNENAGSAVVVVSRTANTLPASVTYVTGGGTATPSVDYTPVSGTLSFAAGETSKTVTVPLLDDTVAEVNETFGLALSAPTDGATLGNTGTVITIASEDAKAVTTITGFQATPRVRAPEGATIVGVLRGPGGVGLGNRTVFIVYAPRDGSSGVKIVRTLTTQESGLFSTTVGPTENTLFAAVFNGTTEEAASQTSAATTLVQLSSAVVAGPRSVRVNGTTSFPGVLRPGVVRPRVKLQWVQANGRVVDLSGAVTVGADSRFTINRRWATKGTFRLRVLGIESAKNIGSSSATFTFRVV